MAFYNILDVSALLKQAWLGDKDPDAIYDADKDSYHNTAEYGAARFLTRFSGELFSQEAFDPRHTIAVFDSGIDYRRNLFPGYKAKREQKKADESQVSRVEWGKLRSWAVDFFKAAGFTQVFAKGVEGDDVIAWLCQGLRNDPKAVHTVDGDLTALVDDNTVVFLKDGPHTAQDEGGYKGVPYRFVSLYKSLIGDTSDEYGGIKGFGPAAWEKLVDTIGEDGLQVLQDGIDKLSAEGIDALMVEHPDSKELVKIRSNWSSWRTMWMVAKLHPELCWKPLAHKFPDVRWVKRVPSAERMQRVLNEVGCSDLYSNFESAMPQVIPVDAPMLAAIKDQLISEIAASDVVAFDYETYDTKKQASLQQATSGKHYVDMINSKITGAGFCFGKHGENVLYLSADHRDTANCDVQEILDLIKAAQTKSQLVVHNLYFEGTVTARNFNDFRLENVHDTMVMMRYIDENEQYGLKACSLRDLNYHQASFEETTQGRDMCDLSLDEVLQYGADDALVTFHLYDLYVLKAKLDGCYDHYCSVVNATPALVDAHLNGVRIDWEFQQQFHEDDIRVRDESLSKMRELLEANCSNPTQPEHFAGVKSYMEYEAKFIRESTRRKLKAKNVPADKIGEQVKAALEREEEKMYEGCRYVPYIEEEVMPSFSPTARQLNPAAVALGLPEIDKVTQEALGKYLDDCHFGTFGENKPSPEQSEWLSILARALAAGVFSTRKNSEEAVKARELLGQATQKVAGVEPKLVRTGTELQLNSSPQMQKLLYGMLALPVRTYSKPTPTRSEYGYRDGGPGTDEQAVTTALALDVEDGSWKAEVLDLLLKCKGAMTRISLYHEKYPLWRREGTDVIHPQFRLCGTDTRRPTGTDPNMLQVSKKEPRMRREFIPPSPDYLVVAIDYAAQEIRLMASESKDPVMCSVYLDEPERDLHSMTGSAIVEMDYFQFIAAMADAHHPMHKTVKNARKKAKTVNFGLAYGSGPSTLAVKLIISLDEARELQAKTMGLYARLKDWKEEAEAKLMEQGFLATPFGTKRHAQQALYGHDKGIVASWVRKCINFTIQGSAAEMLSRVLHLMWTTRMKDRIRFNLGAPIYDEVMAFVHKDDVQQYCNEMKAIMASVTPEGHLVPQVPEFSIGPAWGAWGPFKEKEEWDAWGEFGELGRDISPERVSDAVEKSLIIGKELIWSRIEP